MNGTMMVVGTVEADHTVKVPADLPVGEQVMIVRLPSIPALLRDPQRRARFAATRAAIQQAIQAGFPKRTLSNDEIVALVKRARQATRTE
ncbi:MAG: hypothetical protein DCC55_10130 [Chloroflexi bacterium]|nr:MAG: hypothetical protein DCC55_10130 [Chloroflexota bacterium]